MARGKPLIGVISDHRVIAGHPYHLIGEKYLDAVLQAARGIPVGIPSLAGLDIGELLDQLDGVLLTGSLSNVKPHHYGEELRKEADLSDPSRDTTAFSLIEGALEMNRPLLAICRGCQEFNVALGGTLHQDLEEAGFGGHRDDPSEPQEIQYGPRHEVQITGESFLSDITDTRTARVNSLHHQGIKRLSSRAVALAHSSDGLVEAFHVEDVNGFNLAVQWHPEWKVMEHPMYRALFEAFGAACRAANRYLP